MARKKAYTTCCFCHKAGHIEKNCWKKTPALIPPTTSRQASTKGGSNDKLGESPRPSQHHHSSLASSHDPIDDGNSATGEQEQHCPLFDLPNELLMEIAALLCTPDEYGKVCFESIKSFSLVSKRVRKITTERLHLTVSTRSPFGQLMASKSFLSQIKQLVLKPENKECMGGLLRIDNLLRHIPFLLELNIHVGVPLCGILKEGQLPTVRTLSVPINPDGRVYESTSIIQACPNVTLLRLNLTGRPVWVEDGDGVCRPECRRVLEAAAELGSLRALEVFKFGRPQETLEIDGSSGLFSLIYLESHSIENGWVPDDLKVIREYFPRISSLALYGNVGYNDTTDGHVRISDLLAECGEFKNLNSLTMTTEAIDAWEWIEDEDSSFFFSFERQDQNQDQDELIWSGAGDESCVYPDAGRAFEACASLRELSLVFGEKGRTWATVRSGQEARGTDAEAFKTWDFVNSKYALSATVKDYTKHRWF